MSMSLVAVYLDETEVDSVWRDINSVVSRQKLGLEIPSTPDDFDDSEQLNMANGNMANLFRALGLQITDEGALVPVDVFLRASSQWLQDHIGTPSEAREPVIEKGKGRIVLVVGGVRSGYLNERIHQAVLIAQRGKELGATHISAH